MAKRSTKRTKTDEEKPRAFLFATVTASLISETLAAIERIDRVKPDAEPLTSTEPEQANVPDSTDQGGGR